MNATRELRHIVRKWNCNTKPHLHKIKGLINTSCQSIVPAEIGRIPNVNCLIDTGASLNVISKEMFDKLQSKGYVSQLCKNNVDLVAANNDKIIALGKCRVKVKINLFSWTIETYVVNHLTVPVILGTPFIFKTQLVLDLSDSICYFKFAKAVKIKMSVSNLSLPVCNQLDFNIGCEDMRESVEQIVTEFPEVFSDKIGKALNLEIKLEVVDQTVVNQRPYFMSPPVLKKVKAILDDWLSQGIIRPSGSAYSSPCFLTKKDRLVVNYTQLNAKLRKFNFPLGDLQNYCQHLSGAKYFTIIDLNKSFLQCPLAEESKHLTAFSTIYGKFEYNRLAFGLQIGSSVLSKYMNSIFNDIQFEYLLCYCDDLIVYSPDKARHVEDVREVVSRLAKHGLTANLSKVKFFCKEISFLGNLISYNTVTIDPSRIKALLDYKIPKTAKEVSRFVGMCNFFSKFIENYAGICVPLNQLRRKKVKFVWTNECQEAFVKLKHTIAHPPVLKLADFHKPFTVMSDASYNAMGACLLQEVDGGGLLPVAYYSRKFTDSQRRYSIYEKEALAAILAIEHWHQFLEAQSFKLVTDNQALSFVLSHKNKMGRLSRWVERILNLPFTVEHVRSEDNALADALSRMYENEKEEIVDRGNIVSKYEINCISTLLRNVDLSESNNLNESNSDVLLKTSLSSDVKPNHVNNNGVEMLNLIQDIPLAFEDLVKLQTSDPECLDIMTKLKGGTKMANFYLNKDVLMYSHKNRVKSRIYLPLGLVNLVYKFFHESVMGSHLGIAKTQERIGQYFFRPNLNELIRNKVLNCLICSMSKPTLRQFEGRLVSVPFDSSLQCLFIDLLGPLVKSKEQNMYILVALDGYSRFTWLYALRDCKTSLIVKTLEKVIFSNFSVPQIIVSDNASYFTSHMFKKFCFKNCIQHRKIAAYRANGNRSERAIRNIVSILKAYYHNAQSNWDADLNYVQIALNTAKNDSTKFSPFDLMFNHRANNALSNLWNINNLLVPKSPEESKQNLDKAIQNVKKSILHNRKRDRYSPRHVKHPFKLHSLVVIKTHYQSDKAKRFSKKLALRYIGPYRILYFLSAVTVLVQNVENVFDTRKVHIIDLKLCQTGN